MTDKGTTLPPISGPFGARGGWHRPSLDQVENGGQLTLSQETVVLGFLGCVEFPTYFDIISRTTTMRGGVDETYVLVGDALGRGMVQLLKQQK